MSANSRHKCGTASLPQRLGDDTQMSMMLERPFHPDNMLLILRIGFIELFEDLGLLAPGDIPVR